MRVTAREAFSAYFQYQVHQLAAGQQVDGDLADYLLASGAPVDPEGGDQPRRRGRPAKDKESARAAPGDG
ncbi:hypothetical protein Lfu02_79890 [Longispora fulva]|uniref:Uncharacterized protein n=1 Tax=Longispora fulva TaxID=619741 RepID=A0A8J7GPW2_9ACTN|nr:hypothetical protein [Longispora fulva]MBG6141128.1 hypothetical protein [Longispora fulva]GIG63617.1 hypothetical protein Lfu02_79890 [Longispora fulva]